MKRFIICIALFLVVLTGCDNTKKEEDSFCKDIAISYAVNYLNNEVGYDNEKKYDLTCLLQSDKEMYPQLYQLKEDEKELVVFVIEDADKEQVIGELNYVYNGKNIALSRIWDPEKIARFETEGGSFNINEHLYLENIQSISIGSNYYVTDESQYDVIEEGLMAHLPLYETQEGDEITVYEHLNVIKLKYYNIDREIISDGNDLIYYPWAVNGQIKGIVAYASDTYAVMSAIWMNEEWADAIENKGSFIIALGDRAAIQQGILIKTNDDIDITVPVIVKKAYEVLKKKAEEQVPCVELFSFEYSDN